LFLEIEMRVEVGHSGLKRRVRVGAVREKLVETSFAKGELVLKS
jgi:hypothetical protein